MGPPNKKKRKSQDSQPPPSKKKARIGSNSKSRTVNVDSLPWRPVEIPEMFDDAEGFFGLQVIDGVDVFRQSNGTVEFISDLPPESEGIASVDADNDDDFEGFDDVPTSNGVDDDSTGVELNRDKGSKVDETANSSDDLQLETSAESEEDQVDDEQDELEPGVFAAAGEIPEADEGVEMSAWAPLGLSQDIMSSISRRLKFTKPTAIQAAAIPPILEGHDVIGKASTGSGKTLAFAIPIVQKWLDTQVDAARREGGSKIPTALILSPTRELAHQITNHVKELCSGLAIAPYICSVTGGLSVQKQQRQLPKADIVIGTPGRLWEVLSTSPSLLESFRQVQFLVVDEADRILTEGHFKEAKEIFGALDRIETGVDEDESDSDVAPVPRQTLVFSATFNKNLQQKLAGKGRYDIMNNAQSMEYLLKKLNFREKKPKFIDVNPVSQMAEKLKEGLVECGPTEKDLFLYALLLLSPNKHTLVFANSISAVRRLTPMLQNLNLPTNALHSQMIQKARLRSIERFTAAKANTTSILVATDVAARGLDIPGVEQVIHYHVPRTADMYVHRSGRTARASHSGISVLLCAPEEVVPTRRLTTKVHLEQAGKQKILRELDVDRRLVARLKPRLDLAKRIADAYLAREKGSKDEEWMKRAADDLGVEYDSDELGQARKWGGKGSGRKMKQEELRTLSKRELGVMKAQLRELLSQKINAGVSTKYITGRSDADELLAAKGDFLGKVDWLGFDDED